MKNAQPHPVATQVIPQASACEKEACIFTVVKMHAFACIY